jgi:hypothetical protein
VALGDHCGCVLVTLGGCRHLDGLEKQRASAHVGDFSWPAPMIVRGLIPFLAESRRLTLVDYSCH